MDMTGTGTTWQRMARILLLGWILFLAFPLTVEPLRPGLDAGYIFAINWFFDRQIVFGHDVAFTYGPLGFLICPVPVGHNLGLAWAFQAGLWLLFAAGLWNMARRQAALGPLLVFTLCFTAGLAIRDSLEYFLNFVVLVLLAGVLPARRWLWPYLGAILLTALTFLIKFSCFWLMAGSLVLFLIALALQNRARLVPALLLAGLLLPALTVIGYLAYNPCGADLLRYWQAGLDISSGFNVAMSLPGSDFDLIIALGILLIYAGLAVDLAARRDPAFYTALIFPAALFMAFKHGFVRQDGHSLIFFSSALLVCGLVGLSLRPATLRRPTPLLGLAAVLVLSWIGANHYLPYSTFWANSRSLYKTHRIRQVLQYESAVPAVAGAENLGAYRFPAAALTRIGTNTINIFPWELMAVAANDLNYSPFPICQAYSAYTAGLDRWNADYLENRAKAARFMTFSWQAIDGRHPLADVPATGWALYRWYDVAIRYPGHLLLERRDQPRVDGLKLLSRRDYSRDAVVPIPVSPHPVIVKIYLDLNPVGRLAKFFFRVPPVSFRLTTTGDFPSLRCRVIPDTLRNGLLINNLPWDIPGTVQWLETGRLDYQITSLQLQGALEYFREPMAVEFWGINEDVRGP